MNSNIPRIVLTAASSGQGKTTITCGLIGAMKQRFTGSHSNDESLLVSYKCGPDYIDPMFHHEILKTDSENLDLFFLSEEGLRRKFIESSEGHSLAIIEGVMGFYDGMGMDTAKASTWHVAEVLKAPVILIVDGKGKALSLAAEIRGFMEFRKPSRICGVIINHIREMLYPSVKKMIEQECGIPVFGYVPESEDFRLESRHLGLTFPEEQERLSEKMDQITEQIQQSLDLDGILKLAESAEPIEAPEAERVTETYPLTIGIARDEAMSFYYKANLDLLEQFGCRLVPFSPIHDKQLPEGLDALLFGGGYPELHLKELEANISMKDSIRRFYENGGYVIAECGGFMYLHDTIEDMEGRAFSMAGLIHEKVSYVGKLRRFGYMTIDNRIKAHEFHYWDSSDPGQSYECRKPDGKRHWKEGYVTDTMIAGFPHIYYPSSVETVAKVLRIIYRHLHFTDSFDTIGNHR